MPDNIKDNLGIFWKLQQGFILIDPLRSPKVNLNILIFQKMFNIWLTPAVLAAVSLLAWTGLGEDSLRLKIDSDGMVMVW